MLFEYIQSVRARPRHERRAVALTLSLSITGFVVVVWITILVAGDGLGHYRFGGVVAETSPKNAPAEMQNLYGGRENRSAREELQALMKEIGPPPIGFGEGRADENTAPAQETPETVVEAASVSVEFPPEDAASSPVQSIDSSGASALPNRASSSDRVDPFGPLP